MASFRGTRFPGPMFNQNFPRNNFNMNCMGNRHSMQPFQRPPNPAYPPFQAPERFMHGNFQNRPHFSNFSEPMCSLGFRNRPPFPPPNQVFPSNPSHNLPRLRGPFEHSFRPWNQMSPFGGPIPPFHNRPRTPVPSQQSKDVPLQMHKKRKQNSREFRKLKEYTTEKPFSCDTCDRAFVTATELNDHVSQHIKCDHKNCMFEAHPKIVALHKKMQHDTGYADRISKLKDDAEIQKWREERRRRFPTAETVRKRKAEQAEREARGEVLETKEFGKFKRRREDDGNVANKAGRKRTRGRCFRKSNERRRENFHPRSQPFTINIDSESDTDSDSHITLNKFLGMSSLTNSPREIYNGNEDFEVTSSPHHDVNTISEKREFLSQSLCKQNLPKSEFGNSVCHPNMSCADSNSSNMETDKKAFVLNDDKFSDSLSLGVDPMSEVPGNESAVVIQCDPGVIITEDFVSPANESVCEIPPDESSSIKQEDTELITIEDFVSPADESVCEIPANESSFIKQNPELVTVGESDDEGPTVVPLVKSTENSVAFDSKNTEQSNNVQESFPLSSNGPIKVSDVTNSGKKHGRNGNRSNQRSRKYHNHLNDSNREDPLHVVRKSTLLEKLLADDIRHERNVILQCIRHIVKNNFFGIGSKKS